MYKITSLLSLILLVASQVASAEKLSVTRSKALRFETFRIVGNMQALRAGAILAATPKDLQYCAVYLELKVKWAEGDRMVQMKPDQITLTDADKNVYPLLGQTVLGILSQQPQGPTGYRSGEDAELAISFNPVFAVPASLTTAVLNLGDNLAIDVNIEPASSPSVPEFSAKTRVLACESTTDRIYDEFPAHHGAPVHAVDWQPISGEWIKLTVEFEPEKGNHWGNANLFQIDSSRFGLLQAVNGRSVFTPCAGRQWVKGLADMPERIQVGQKGSVVFYFCVPALAKSGKLLYEGRPIADVSLSK